MQASSVLVRHALVLAACLAGVFGMGMVFQGAMHDSIPEMARGGPFLLIGVFWAGRELGRSMLLSRQNGRERREKAARPVAPEEGTPSALTR